MADLTFSGYPENCPLPEADDCGGGVFRVTKNDPPSDEDFLSQHELGFVPKYTPTAARACKARSLSVYKVIEDARHHVKVFAAHGTYIAAATLTPDRGKIMPTPPADGSRPSHCEWWCADGQDRRGGFVILE